MQCAALSTPRSPFVEIGREHQLLHLFKQAGAAVGGVAGGGFGVVDGFVRGAVDTVKKPDALAHAMALGSKVGAAAGALVGLAAGCMLGTPITAAALLMAGASCGLVLGTATGAVIRVAAGGAEAVPAGVSRGWDRGREVGEHAASAIVRGQTAAMIWLGDKIPVLHTVALAVDRFFMDEPKGTDLQRFHNVDGAVYRSAQPGPEVWKDLAAKGFKSVVNLRWETDYEKQAVEDAGLATLYIPESPLKRPTVDQALEFLRFVTDPKHQPVLFHCYSGVDRTGTMAACYRIAVQGWTQERALQEALEMGLVPELQADKIAFIQTFNAAWQDMQAKGTAPHFPH